MIPSPEATLRIHAVEAKLAELDPIIHDFCKRNRYTFSSTVGVWPRRKVWAREDVDRTLDLVMDLSVSDVMERGFYSEMPWSLCATASLLLPAPDPGKLLSQNIFHALACSELAKVLAARLEEGLLILQKITREDVINRGQIHGNTR